MGKDFFSKPSTKEKRQVLRKEMTDAERLLWSKLRNRQLCDLKFRRQYGLGEYIVDFYCPELCLVIELDGSRHYSEEGRENDHLRAEYMAAMNIRTVRFPNSEVLKNLDGVLVEIGKAAGKRSS